MHKRLIAGILIGLLLLLLNETPVMLTAAEKNQANGVSKVIEVEGNIKINEIVETNEATTTTVEDFTITDGILTAYSGTASRVVIPDTVTEIGAEVFRMNETTEELVIPVNVIKIGESAFRECASLHTVTMAEGVTEIGAHAFKDCDALVNLTLSGNLTTMGSQAFGSCDSLESVWVPKTLTSVSSSFAGCNNLKTVTFEEGMTKIPSTMITRCPALTTVNLPESVVEIDYQAFFRDTGLTGITLPSKIKQLGNKCFGSTGLKEIFLPKTLSFMSEPFSDSTLEKVTLENGTTKILRRAFMDATALTEVVVPDTVTEIEEEAFYGATALTEFEIPGCVMAIPARVFADCTSLQKVIIPSSVTVIESSAFSGSNAVVIYGIKGSYAETFAAQQGITFVELQTGAGGSITDPSQEAKVRAFMERMYSIVLRRTPDEAGLSDWVVSLMEHRVDGATVAHGFFNSAEFVARGLDDTEYVKVLYQAILGREATNRECGNWVVALTNGQSRQEVLDGFVKSTEFVAICENYGIIAYVTQEDMVRDFVERMYTVALNRAADSNGLEDWVRSLMEGKTDGAKIADGFINSPEFAARNLSDTDYIKTLYRTFLDREADEQGLNDWLAAFAWGATRQDLLTGFVESAEFKTLCNSYGIIAVTTREDLVQWFVKRMYTVALEREPEKTGLANWTNSLLTGTVDGASVAKGFINSFEFGLRDLKNEVYIKTLYRTLFGREPGTDEVAFWENTFANGMARFEMLNYFLDSVEFQTLCDSYGIAKGNIHPQPTHPGAPVLSAVDVTLRVGESYQLRVNNYSGNITYSVHETLNDVTIDAGGKITALRPGNGRVSVYCGDAILVCNISVLNVPAADWIYSADGTTRTRTNDKGVLVTEEMHIIEGKEVWGYFHEEYTREFMQMVQDIRLSTRAGISGGMGEALGVVNTPELILTDSMQEYAKQRAVESTAGIGSESFECYYEGFLTPESLYMDCIVETGTGLSAIMNYDFVYGGAVNYWWDRMGTGIDLYPYWILDLDLYHTYEGGAGDMQWGHCWEIHSQTDGHYNYYCRDGQSDEGTRIYCGLGMFWNPEREVYEYKFLEPGE